VKKLSYQQQQELRYFKQQEAQWSEERFKNDADKNAVRNYEYAKRELKDFVIALRKKGYNI
jgi:hypothetical protein|tara:strand:+ start:42 stop:224 length:183 start_codon:yes stop_codon:yes gene_type:complete